MVTNVARTEEASVATIAQRIVLGMTVHSDEAAGWDRLHDRFLSAKEIAIGRKGKVQVPYDLLQEAIGIGEMAVIAAPYRFQCWAHEASPRRLRPGKHDVHLVPDSRIVGQDQAL